MTSPFNWDLATGTSPYCGGWQIRMVKFTTTTGYKTDTSPVFHNKTLRPHTHTKWAQKGTQERTKRDKEDYRQQRRAKNHTGCYVSTELTTTRNQHTDKFHTHTLEITGTTVTARGWCVMTGFLRTAKYFRRQWWPHSKQKLLARQTTLILISLSDNFNAD